MHLDLNTEHTHAGASSLLQESFASYELARVLLQNSSLRNRINDAYHYAKTEQGLSALFPYIGELWARSHASGVVYDGRDIALLHTVELAKYGTRHQTSRGGERLSGWDEACRAGNWSSRDWQDEHHEACLQYAA